MNFKIVELDAFTLIAQAIKITNSQKQNMQICASFWKTFNIALKQASLTQSGNWVKYAFMQRKANELFYYCAIPKQAILPDTFIVKEVPSSTYFVVEHIGTMDTIYQSYTKLYKQLLPEHGYTPIQDEFLHFEKYDHRFHWNRSNSVIEIWVPIATIRSQE